MEDRRMTIKLAVIMDPIESIKAHKDSTFAMLLEAQRRDWELYYITPNSLYVIDGNSYGQTSRLYVEDNESAWFRTEAAMNIMLASFDVILMRKDPPFDMEYIYTTYILELAKNSGSLVINDPAALRNCNEKFSIMNFPQCCVPTLVTCNQSKILEFIDEYEEIIVKPMDAMGGKSIFKILRQDKDKKNVVDKMTQQGNTTIMTQRFIPEITQGDKRILIINGEPVPYALARIPKEGELLGNLAAGGRGEGIALTERDYWICSEIKDSLVDNSIYFAGIDVIGSYLTEINITSPTCIRELDKQFNLNISAQLFDEIEASLT